MFHLVAKLKNKTIQEKRNSLYATIITFGNKTYFFSGLIFRFTEKSAAVTLFTVASSTCSLSEKLTTSRVIIRWKDILSKLPGRYSLMQNLNLNTSSCHGLCLAFDIKKELNVFETHFFGKEKASPCWWVMIDVSMQQFILWSILYLLVFSFCDLLRRN